MHPMGARLGQECVRITGSDFASVIFGSQYRLPSYLHWVTSEADMAPTYRWQLRPWHIPIVTRLIAFTAFKSVEVAIARSSSAAVSSSQRQTTVLPSASS